MQMANLNNLQSYQKNFRNLPRIASFIGTSNRSDLMSDPTGSRRFFCVEVEKPINCEGIEHEQIFAQLKAELADGCPYWFDKETEREIQQNMHPFTVLALPKRYFSVVSAPQPQRKRNICDFLPPIFIKN